jgi:gamma-glutamyltranspeptidase/glutathione hydrolase
LTLLPSWVPPLSIALGLALAAPTVQSAEPSRGGAVATEHPLCTRAALDVLSQGGDAVDAAVAASLMAGVVSPTSSGLGGGGFALVLTPGATQPVVIDFREVAPRGLDAAALGRRPLPFEARGQLVGVPGEAAGLFELVRRFGKRPWASLVEPAARQARRGFAVGPHLAQIVGGQGAAEYRREPGLGNVYFPGGHAALEGRVIKNPKLSRTLSRLGAEGPKILIEGTIADELVRTVKGAGGALEKQDLAEYAVRERQPLHIVWGGDDIFTMPPPSAGGLLLAETLGMLSREELVRLAPSEGAYQHLLAEAFRSALWDRFVHVGDPDAVPLDTTALLAPSRLAERRRGLALDRTHSLPLLAAEEHGTHHLVVADASGMVVSLTTTVNHVFGAKLVLPEAGIALNDELDDFALERDAASMGLKSLPNAPRAGARPVSSMTPTIVVRQGRPVVAIGGSGGMAISTNVAQLLIAHLVRGTSASELVKLPRFFIPLRGSTILLEAGAPQSLRSDLEYRGERVGTFPSFATAVQVLTRPGDAWEAAADPRKHGSGVVAPAR